MKNKTASGKLVELRQLHEEITTQALKHERGIRILGSRWSFAVRESVRGALAGILKKNFGVQVLNVNEYDDRGEEFGRPDQVELD